jgi:hypothetical protein
LSNAFFYQTARVKITDCFATFPKQSASNGTEKRFYSKVLLVFIDKFMQDQEFTKDQVSENLENQQSEFTLPEAETLPNINVGDADLPEQETVVFSQPVEDPPADQFEVPVQTVSSADTVEDEELFGKYEIKNWDFNPRLYKIFAFSAIFNILFVVAVAQTNILRSKACDSPLVGGFCQVIDTLYVGGKILGTDSEFVDKPYERTELENAEIVWLDQTGIEPPLDYPAGYFQIANPEMYQTVDPLANPDNSGFPTVVNPAPMNPNPTMPNPTTVNPTTPNSPGVLGRKQRLAKPNKNAIPKDLPDGTNIPTTEDDNTADTKKPEKDPKTENKTGDNTAKTEPKSDPLTEVELNRRPLIDLGIYVSELLKENKVDLNTPFLVQAKGKLNKDGKIEKDSYKITQAVSNDQDMLEVINRSISAINDSGYLQYIKQLSGKDLNLMIKQDEQNISAQVESEMESERRAKSLKTTLDLAISLFKSKKQEDIKAGTSDQNDLDDLALLEGAKVEIQGKKIIIKFDVKKEVAQPMVERKLKISKDDPNTKPNSTAQTANPKENTSK